MLFCNQGKSSARLDPTRLTTRSSYKYKESTRTLQRLQAVEGDEGYVALLGLRNGKVNKSKQAFRKRALERVQF